MKGLIRNITVNSVALYFLSLVLSGVSIQGGFFIYLIGGFVLSIMDMTIRPILSLLSLPLNLVTLGLFSFFSNAIILYLLTVIVPDIRITAFTFQGITFAGFVIPSMYFNGLFAYVVAALALSFFYSYFEWLVER